MSGDFDSEIVPIHHVDHLTPIDYNTALGDSLHPAHLHPAHHVQIEEPAQKPVFGKVEQSFMIGVFIICVILVVITLCYVNFPPKNLLLY